MAAISPSKETVTLHIEVIASVGSVLKASTDQIQLRCSREEHVYMEPFVKTEFAEEKTLTVFLAGYGTSTFSYGIVTYMNWRYFIQIAMEVVEHQHIPSGKLVI